MMNRSSITDNGGTDEGASTSGTSNPFTVNHNVAMDGSPGQRDMPHDGLSTGEQLRNNIRSRFVRLVGSAFGGHSVLPSALPSPLTPQMSTASQMSVATEQSRNVAQFAVANQSSTTHHSNMSASGHIHSRPMSASTAVGPTIALQSTEEVVDLPPIPPITIPGYRTIAFVPRRSDVPPLDLLMFVNNEIFEDVVPGPPVDSVVEPELNRIVTIPSSSAMSSSPSPVTNHKRPAQSSTVTTDSTAPKRLCVRGNASLAQSAASSSSVGPINASVRGSPLPRMSSSELYNALLSNGSTYTSPTSSSSLSAGIGIKLDEQTAASNSPQQANPDQLPSNVIIETVQYEDYIQQKIEHETKQPNQEGQYETNWGEMIEMAQDEVDCDCEECVEGIEITDEDEECDCDRCVDGLEFAEEDGECFCEECVEGIKFGEEDGECLCEECV